MDSEQHLPRSVGAACTMAPVLFAHDAFNPHSHGPSQLPGENWLRFPLPAKVIECSRSSKVVPRRPELEMCL